MKFSPAAGIVCAVVFSFFTAFRGSIGLFDAVFPVFLLIINADSLFTILKRLVKLNLFVVFVVFFLLAAHSDREYALLVFLRANLILAVNISLFIKFSPEDFYYGFHTLRLPDRFTVLLFFCIKYIDILGREYEKMKEALKVRGFVPRTDIFTYRTLAYTAGMLLVRSMDRAVKLSECMTLRGFKGRLFPFNRAEWERSDMIVISMLIMQLFLSFGGIV